MKRLESETFEEYRLRRLNSKIALKAFLKGRMLWNSKNKGTYRRSTK